MPVLACVKCSDSTVLPAQLCLSLLHDMILSTSVFTAVWWWSRDLFSLVSVCLQRVQSVRGWWEVVLLCEVRLLTDDLSCTTVAIVLMVRAITLEQYFHFFLVNVFLSCAFTQQCCVVLKAKCFKFKWVVSTLMLFTLVVCFPFRTVYNFICMDFASQHVYLRATVTTSKVVLVFHALSPWTTICIYFTLLILLPFFLKHTIHF